MSDNKGTLLEQLRGLNLSADEAEVYLELLLGPSTHLRLSRQTGITRTKVYRLVEMLEKRSLVAHRTDDRGTFLVAADPSTLEVQLLNQEQKLKQQRTILSQLVPSLAALQANDTNLFVVRTYEGLEGLKQMCWHELKTKKELLALGAGTIEEMVPSHRWAEKHRALNVQAGYHIREIINAKYDAPTFTQNQEFMKGYSCRSLSREVLPLDIQTIIYNDTVAIYHWRQEKKVGVEIISRTYADTMRNMFEHYWQLAKPG